MLARSRTLGFLAFLSLATAAHAEAPCLDCIRPELREQIAPAVRYERLAVAEDENGLPLLRLAADLVRAPKLAAVGEACGGPLSPAEAEVLERNRLSLWLLGEAQSRPHFQWAPYQNGELFYRYRQVLLLELLSARAGVAEGDAAGAASDVESAFALARRMAYGDAELIHFLVGIWAERAAMSAMRCLAAGDLPEASLTSLLSAVSAPPTPCEIYARAWRVELNTFWIPSVQDLQAQSKWHGPPLAEAVQRASAGLATHLAACGGASGVRCPAAASPDDFDPAAYVAAVWSWSAERVATQTILALRLYEFRHGGPPASLEALVADGLVAAPPGDPMTGAPVLFDRENATVQIDVPPPLLACHEGPERLSWQIPGAR